VLNAYIEVLSSSLKNPHVKLEALYYICIYSRGVSTTCKWCQEMNVVGYGSSKTCRDKVKLGLNLFGKEETSAGGNNLAEYV